MNMLHAADGHAEAERDASLRVLQLVNGCHAPMAEWWLMFHRAGYPGESTNM